LWPASKAAGAVRFRFDEFETNIPLTNRATEFSPSQGQKRRFGRASTMSGLRPKADVATSVRFWRIAVATAKRKMEPSGIC
jgi:hypothetical protein